MRVHNARLGASESNRHFRTARKIGHVPPARRVAVAKSRKQELLNLVAECKLCTSSSEAAQRAIVNLVEQLALEQQGMSTNGACLSGTWKLLWTTEKETLFILKNAKWFGTKAGDVYQVIQAGNWLQNVITFPPNGAFIVDSLVECEGLQRTNFRFTSAKLKVSGRTVALPPIGTGWFDTLYLDDTMRVARDIRGDYLVVSKTGPPQKFV